jgi:GT2 family glycosyltransferase
MRVQTPAAKTPVLGVVIVSYRSGDVILECLETLLASPGVDLKVVVVDNASPDDTVQILADWASGKVAFEPPANSPVKARSPLAKPAPLVISEEPGPSQPLGPLTLIRSTVNRGFAGGVNVGLRALSGQADWYWILNPDCVVPPTTAADYVRSAQADPHFSLMTCTTAYYDHPELIQSAGGWVDRRTGVCHQRGCNASIRELDATTDSTIQWVSGANMVASPRFLERASLMREDYFLYYEEVDWAFRRGELPLRFLHDTIVYHHGGTTIGSGAFQRRPTAFSNYFNHRNRIRFARRMFGRAPLLAYGFGLAKAVQLLLLGAPDEAQAVIAGMFELRPPAGIRERIADPAAAEIAFARAR